MLPQPEEEEEVAPNSPGPKASQEELEHYCRYKLASHVALLGRVQNEVGVVSERYFIIIV